MHEKSLVTHYAVTLIFFAVNKCELHIFIFKIWSRTRGYPVLLQKIILHQQKLLAPLSTLLWLLIF